jgi:type II secretory pathway pseudopilin PulG
VQTIDLKSFTPRPRRARRAFTMVEILITIGVIMLLVAIGVIAYRGLDKMASERATHVALDNATAMIAEYEHGGVLQNFVMVDPTNPSAFWVATQTTTPIDTTNPGVNLSDVSSNGNSRNNAVAQNGAVVFRLIRLPKNKSSLSALPQKALIDQPASNGNVGAPAIADGWRNPILFCPAAGIQVYLHFGESSQSKQLITSPDHRPFWVSAGPDGDFSKGDDNVYSFSK